MRYETGCCLDKNTNSICDSDENPEELIEQLEKSCPEGGKFTPFTDESGKQVKTIQEFREFTSTQDPTSAKAMAKFTDAELEEFYGVYQLPNGVYICATTLNRQS
jgi:hypothetical protein